MNILEKIKNVFNNNMANTSIETIDKNKNITPDITKGMPELIREASNEGAVLLKNNGMLPLNENDCVSVFSRIQCDWFYTGYGAGGIVNAPYLISFADALKNSNINYNKNLLNIYKTWCSENVANRGTWGSWQQSFPDMPLNDEIVKKAKEESNSAIYVIGRAAGEVCECKLEKGSYYLTDVEKRNIELITKYFDKVTIILNIGNIIDFSYFEQIDDKINAILLVWQGGMESGNSVCDLISGKANPCGKLSDTIAKQYSDYPSKNFGCEKATIYEEDIYVGYRYFETFCPDKVLYPFGFGLSYTQFNINFVSANKTDNGVIINCTVKNIGKLSGKEVVQVYIKKPLGKLGNPAKELVAFKKTKLLMPNETENLSLFIPSYFFASYDDSEKTKFSYSYLFQKGIYILYLGNDIRNSNKIFSYQLNKDILFEKHEQTLAPQKSFNRYINKNGNLEKEKSPTIKYNLHDIILNNLPRETKISPNKGYKLLYVKNKVITLDEFISQLSLEELEAISRGDYTMDSPLGTKGNASVLAGVLQSLREKGIPAISTNDGPAGLRLESYTSQIPMGTLLACSFNLDLVNKLFEKLSEEMINKKCDVLLAPGMNIHRNVLCGRNFEYYSEDPFLTGMMASATVKGIEKNGASSCIKHFACNNQEFNRQHNNSIVSERALREIYLRGFELCIKTVSPKCIMTSYNKINGVWSHYNYELCVRILRKEWNYNGLVMTDWGMQYTKSPEFKHLKDNGYRVRAGVDVLMPGGKHKGKRKPDGTLLKTLGKKEGITIGEMQEVAKHVLELSLNFI